MSWKDDVIEKIKSTVSQPVQLQDVESVGGGDINSAYRFKTSEGDFFVKKNSASRYPQMFQKEALGLATLAAPRIIAVPEPVCYGENDDVAFLVLKFIESGSKTDSFWDDFGSQLANLHKCTDSNFGLDHDNYIGSLYQSNKKHNNWNDFFREERLVFQVKLARDHGNIDPATVKSFDKFYNRIEELFPEEPPALIHGDLWGGNYIVGEGGEPVIIDPAVYYGHREMDLGMSKLFGGFSAAFYQAYHETYPLEKGWQERLDYCNLYPLMVHVNLFGGGYLNSVKSILSKFR